MAVHDLLARNPRPTDLEVREAVSGNLCRCTGYGRVLAAVQRAAGSEQGSSW
jgi:carbon-monoxide dehydrogenase small subunit